MSFYRKTKKLFSLSNNFIILLKPFFWFISSSSPQIGFWSFLCAWVFYKDEIKHSAVAQIRKTHLLWLLRDVNLQHPLDCLGRVCEKKGPEVPDQLPKIE